MQREKKKKMHPTCFVSTWVLIRLGRQLDSKLVEAFCTAKAGDKCASTLSVTLTKEIAYLEKSTCINVLLAALDRGKIKDEKVGFSA